STAVAAWDTGPRPEAPGATTSARPTSAATTTTTRRAVRPCGAARWTSGTGAAKTPPNWTASTVTSRGGSAGWTIRAPGSAVGATATRPDTTATTSATGAAATTRTRRSGARCATGWR